MSAGEVAGLIAAGAFVVLVGLLALPILRLTRALGETQRSIERLTNEAIPTLRGTATTVDGVNTTLTHADTIVTNVADMSTNASSLTSLLTATVGGPVVKVSAFSYGVRRALAHRRALDAPGPRGRTGAHRRGAARVRRAARRGGAA